MDLVKEVWARKIMCSAQLTKVVHHKQSGRARELFPKN
jgi:hypothetical protein